MNIDNFLKVQFIMEHRKYYDYNETNLIINPN